MKEKKSKRRFHELSDSLDSDDAEAELSDADIIESIARYFTCVRCVPPSVVYFVAGNN